MTITVAIADDHPVILDGLERVFSQIPDITVVARCVNGIEAVEAVHRHRPDVLILDLKMPRGDGMSAIQRLHAENSATRIILLTAAVDDEQMISALRLGVRGVVLKELAPDLLVEAVRRVASGGQWLERHVSVRTVNALLRAQATGGDEPETVALTTRELELVKLVGTGIPNKQIAEQLAISEGTVKAHLANVYRKCGVTSRIQLILHLRSKGLL